MARLTRIAEISHYRGNIPETPIDVFATMLWITLIFAAVATWAVLSLVAADHCDRMNRMQARLRESAKQAARRQQDSQQIPVIGGPPSQP